MPKEKSKCRIPEKPAQVSRPEYQEIADFCYQRNRERCEKDPIDEYELCLVKPLSKHATRQNAYRWIRYNPSSIGGGSYTTEDILKRSERIIRKIDDPSVLEDILYGQVCPYRGGNLDTRDITYFLKKYTKDKKHRIFLPDPALQKRPIEEEDIAIVWNSLKEDGEHGELHMPRQLQNALQSFEGDWMMILMVLKTEMHKSLHSNFLIYYPSIHVVTRIEPHGYNFGYYDQKNLDRRLKQAFARYGIEYVPPIDSNIRQGPAHLTTSEMFKLDVEDLPIDPGGFCQTWTYFMMQYMFQHPKLSPAKAMKGFVDEIWNTNYLYIEYLRAFHGMIQGATDTFFNRYAGDTPESEKDYDDLFYEHYPDIYRRYQRGLIRRRSSK